MAYQKPYSCDGTRVKSSMKTLDKGKNITHNLQEVFYVAVIIWSKAEKNDEERCNCGKKFNETCCWYSQRFNIDSIILDVSTHSRRIEQFSRQSGGFWLPAQWLAWWRDQSPQQPWRIRWPARSNVSGHQTWHTREPKASPSLGTQWWRRRTIREGKSTCSQGVGGHQRFVVPFHFAQTQRR